MRTKNIKPTTPTQQDQQQQHNMSRDIDIDAEHESDVDKQEDFEDENGHSDGGDPGYFEDNNRGPNKAKVKDEDKNDDYEAGRSGSPTNNLNDQHADEEPGQQAEVSSFRMCSCVGDFAFIFVEYCCSNANWFVEGPIPVSSVPQTRTVRENAAHLELGESMRFMILLSVLPSLSFSLSVASLWC